jgi:hypothetical protein
MVILSNRTGPVAPFQNISFLAGGNNVRFVNTDSNAKPMFEVGLGNFSLYLFSGECVRGGFGAFGDLSLPAAPLIDVQGGQALIEAGGGWIGNNAITDTVGFGFVEIDFNSDSFISDFFDGYQFPLFTGAGGMLALLPLNTNRYRVDGANASGPANAVYNDYVRADTSGGPVQVIAPSANPALGERFTVKDVTGNAAANNITITPQGTDTIENGLITTAFGSKTWLCNGAGAWELIASV